MSIERFGLDPDGKLGMSADDVINIKSKDFGLESMTKLSLLLEAVAQWSRSNNQNKGSEAQWFIEEGFLCEILRTSGGGWQKGKMRFRLEFLPDNPEAFLTDSPVENKTQSPLDDLRSNLDV